MCNFLNFSYGSQFEKRHKMAKKCGERSGCRVLLSVPGTPLFTEAVRVVSSVQAPRSACSSTMSSSSASRISTDKRRGIATSDWVIPETIPESGLAAAAVPAARSHTSQSHVQIARGDNASVTVWSRSPTSMSNQMSEVPINVRQELGDHPPT